MDTIRGWLNEVGFHWGTGKIVHQWEAKDDPSAFRSSPGWEQPTHARYLDVLDTDVLDKPFKSGFGGPECPRFVAEDAKAFYFPGQYDGSTFLVVVLKDITQYLDVKNETPYPGG